MVFTDQGGQPEEGITAGSKTGRISKPRRIKRKRREAPFTERQLELLRARVHAYYLEHHRGPRKLSWGGLCDEIFEKTKVLIKEDDLQQWATKFIEKRRKTSRHPPDEGFVAIANFLMDPDIGMLSESELNEPEIPHRFAALLLDFLKHPGYTQKFPPLALSGTYEALCKDEDGTIRPTAWLQLEVREGDHVIRIWELSQTWSFLQDARTDDVETLCKKLLKARSEAYGCGIITPEDSLIIFLKDKYSGHNHYYFTLASYPSLWSDTSLLQFALLRHKYPVPDDFSDKYPDELFNDMEDETVFLHFTKMNPHG